MHPRGKDRSSTIITVANYLRSIISKKSEYANNGFILMREGLQSLQPDGPTITATEAPTKRETSIRQAKFVGFFRLPFRYS